MFDAQFLLALRSPEACVGKEKSFLPTQVCQEGRADRAMRACKFGQNILLPPSRLPGQFCGPGGGRYRGAGPRRGTFRKYFAITPPLFQPSPPPLAREPRICTVLDWRNFCNVFARLGPRLSQCDQERRAAGGGGQ